MMADAQFLETCEEDRRKAEEFRKQQQIKEAKRKGDLRDGLEKQLRQQQIERETKRLRLKQEQEEMDQIVAGVRQREEDERRAEKERAQRQKDFQEAQQAENLRLAEQRKKQEREEQLRQVAVVEAAQREARDKEIAKKTEQKSQWQQRVLEDNVHRFHDRKRERAEKIAADRETIRQMNERFDADERTRAEAKARKEARRDYFGKLASAVAANVQSKDQQHLDKIDREAERQEEQDLLEKQRRLAASKQRAADTKQMLQLQKQEREKQKEAEARETELLAAAVRAQAEAEKERQKQEKDRQRELAAKQREFLDSQIQAQFMRETQPMETSIMRPRNAKWDDNSSAIRTRLASRNSNNRTPMN